MIGLLLTILLVSTNCYSQNMVVNSYVFTQAPAFSPLLDTYTGASAAYSLRRMSSTYNSSIIEVRRTDGATQNISLSGNYLDTAALKTFCGFQNCFVRTLYDQSGNNRNLIQATLANQPLIVSAGNINYNGGEPAILFDGVNDHFRTTFTIGAVLTRFVVMTHLSPQNDATIPLDDGASADRAYLTFPSLNTLRILGPGGSVSISPVANAVQFSSFNLFNGTNSAISYNSSAVNTGVIGSTTYSGIAIATRGGGTPGYYSNIHFHELVMYPNNQTTNRVAINTNINSYYSIN